MTAMTSQGKLNSMQLPLFYFVKICSIGMVSLLPTQQFVCLLAVVVRSVCVGACVIVYISLCVSVWVSTTVR